MVDGTYSSEPERPRTEGSSSQAEDSDGNPITKTNRSMDGARSGLPRGTTFRFVLLVAAVFAAAVYYAYLVAPPGLGSLAITSSRCESGAEDALTLAKYGGVAEIPYLDKQTALAQKCMLPAGFAHLWWMSGMLGLLLLITAALYLCTPWWKIHRRGLVPLPPGDLSLHADIEDLMTRAGLTRRPVVLLDPLSPGANGLAFGRFGRYYVRLDGGLVVLRRTDPDAFRAVVLHEFAHLHNRDVNQTYLALALWRGLLLTVLTSVATPYLYRGLAGWFFTLDNARSFGLPITALTALVYVSRNALLRSRELHADAWTASVDGGAALTRVLQDAPYGRQSVLRSVVALVSKHPTPAARRAAIAEPARLYRTGFWEAAAAGVSIAMFYALTAFCVTTLFISPSVDALEWPAAILAVPVTGMLTLSAWRDTVSSVVTGRAQGLMFRAPAGLGVGMAAGAAAAYPIQSPLWLPAALTTAAAFGAFQQWTSWCAVTWLPSIRPASLSKAWLSSALIGFPAVAAVLLIVLSPSGNDFWQVTGPIFDPLYAKAAAIGWLGPRWLFDALFLSQSLSEVSGVLLFSAAILLWAVPVAGWLRSPSLPPGPPLRRAAAVGLAAGALCCCAEVVLQAAVHASFPTSIRSSGTFAILTEYWRIGLVLVIEAIVSVVVSVWRRHGVTLGLLAAFVTGLLGALGVIGDTTLGGCVSVLAEKPHSCTVPRADGFTATVLRLVVVDGTAVALLAGLVAVAVHAAVRRRAADSRSHDRRVPEFAGGDARAPGRRARALTVVAMAALTGLSIMTRNGGDDLSQDPQTVALMTAPTPDDPAQAITTWITVGGGSYLTDVHKDDTTLETDLSSQADIDSDTFEPTCVVLEKDATAALTFAPIPDSTLQQFWFRELTNFREAGRDCVAGVNGADTGVSFENEMSAAESSFDQLAEQLSPLLPAVSPSP